MKQGDTVVTSTLTFAATANAIRYVGAEPVFVDCDRHMGHEPRSPSPKSSEASARRGKLPAAIVVVDLYGQCADMDPIQEACARYDVPIVEDAAEALGATYKGRPAGSHGSLGVFSFNGNKIITTSGGGMLVGAREDWIDQARFLATQARDPARTQHSCIGYNYRLSNLLAAVEGGDSSKCSRTASPNAAPTTTSIARPSAPCRGSRSCPEAPYGRSTRWLTCLTLDPARFGATREDVRRKLETLNIEARPVWKPMHLQPVFSGCRIAAGGEVAAELFERGLCLPSGSSLTHEELEFVVKGFRSTLGVPRKASFSRTPRPQAATEYLESRPNPMASRFFYRTAQLLIDLGALGFAHTFWHTSSGSRGRFPRSCCGLWRGRCPTSSASTTWR